MRAPEILRQGGDAGVEQVSILQDLVVFVVLRADPERSRLDAQVDVLGDQHHLALGHLLHEGEGDGEDGIVRLGAGEHLRQRRVERAGLQVQPTGATAQMGVLERRGDRQSGLDLGDIGIGHQIREKAAGLTDIARDLGAALLDAIQLFQHDHR